MGEEEKVVGHEHIQKGTVQETMLGPLWARATYSQLYPEILDDQLAVDILNKIDHNFEGIKKFLGEWRSIGLLIRARSLDNAIRDYMNEHPECTVVNIAAGLETSFNRVDNGRIKWYNVDLPDAIKFRKKLIPEKPRSTCIPKSTFDSSWMDKVDFNPEKGIIFIAGGFFYYFTEKEVSEFFRALSSRFLGGRIAFDSVSKLAVKVINKRAKKYNSDLSFSLGIGKPEKIIPKWSDKLKIVDWYSMYSRTAHNPKWQKNTLNMIKRTERLKVAKIIIVEFIND